MSRTITVTSTASSLTWPHLPQVQTLVGEVLDEDILRYSLHYRCTKLTVAQNTIHTIQSIPPQNNGSRSVLTYTRTTHSHSRHT